VQEHPEHLVLMIQAPAHRPDDIAAIATMLGATQATTTQATTTQVTTT